MWNRIKLTKSATKPLRPGVTQMWDENDVTETNIDMEGFEKAKLRWKQFLEVYRQYLN